jgi:hypothetical protein
MLIWHFCRGVDFLKPINLSLGLEFFYLVHLRLLQPNLPTKPPNFSLQIRHRKQ